MQNAVPIRVQLGVFELDFKAGELRQGANRVRLQEQPFQVLRMLVERSGEVVTRNEIKHKLWPNDTVVEFDHSIHNAINKLRQALGDSADKPKYVETVGRRGYRLLVPVQCLESSSGDGVGADEAFRSSDTAAGAPPFGKLRAGSFSPQAKGWGSFSGLIGKKVSHYRVLEIVGGGGMGLVYKAEDLKLGRRVALKFLPEELARDPIALQRFEREAQTASSLNHPNICYIHEFGEHEGQPFIAMELLEGETLRDRLAAVAEAAEKVPLDELLRIATQVADGLEAAHEQGIIHRDIKPANIFLTRKGTAKILDFGLAKLAVGEPNASTIIKLSSRATRLSATADDRGVEGPAVPSPHEKADPSTPCPPGREDAAGEERGHSARDDNSMVVNGTAEAAPLQNLGAADADSLESITPADHTLTRTGVAMGTAGYMSPEQVRGEKLDARTDLFSFGLVLYEMATGRRAFSGETAAVLKDAILNNTPAPVRAVNAAIPAKLEQVIAKAIEKDRGKRYQSAAQMRADLEVVGSVVQPASTKPIAHRGWKLVASVTAVIVAMAIAGGYWQRLHKTPAKLTAKDTIVLADFSNSTGDPIFDGTLRQALDLNLQQSPWLKVLSERKVSEALQTIKHRSSEPLTPPLALQVCKATHSRAVVTGSIANQGNSYLIGLQAADCETGDVLSEISTEAQNREVVIHALGEAGTRLRSSLGDSTASQADFNQPLEVAATPSLDALQEYVRSLDSIGSSDPVPHLKRAVELDPNFALVYQQLGRHYTAFWQSDLAAESFTKAYSLRDRLGLRHKLGIEASYYMSASGELEKAVQTFSELLRTFPESGARNQLCFALRRVGRLEQAVAVCREAIRFNRNETFPVANTIYVYVFTDRPLDAQAILDEAQAGIPNREVLADAAYTLAFARGDRSAMQRYFDLATAEPGVDAGVLFFLEAYTETYYGHLEKARQLWQQAAASVNPADLRETVAGWRAREALLEAELGHGIRARQLAAGALAFNGGRDVKAMVALTLARAGDTPSAQKLVDQLNREFPQDTLIQSYELPVIRASVELQKNHPHKAIENLLRSIPYEQAVTSLFPNFFPPYVRGQAYLQAGQWQQAAAEFQKVLDHPGLVGNFVSGPLGLLQLGRAQAMMGDKAAARKSYQDFLTLWKDADPDIPIYQQAKAEYEKLR